MHHRYPGKNETKPKCRHSVCKYQLFKPQVPCLFDVEDSVETLLRQSCQFTYVEVNRELSGGTGMSPSAYGAYYDDQVPKIPAARVSWGQHQGFGVSTLKYDLQIFTLHFYGDSTMGSTASMARQVSPREDEEEFAFHWHARQFLSGSLGQRTVLDVCMRPVRNCTDNGVIEVTRLLQEITSIIYIYNYIYIYTHTVIYTYNNIYTFMYIYI